MSPSDAVPAPIPSPDPEADPFGWLEDVDGPEARAWVDERNAETLAGPATAPGFAALRDAVREVLDSPARIPEVSAVGDLLYGFWRDAEHPRGLWRRTTPESYRTADPAWEVVLDLDALNAAEGQDWVWHGASILRPEHRLALVALSHGGSDADTTREFDLVTRTWVDPADGGFVRPAAKGDARWVDEDTLLVTTDLGEGTTTSSGYPRSARRWHRGTPLDSAEIVFDGEEDDLAISAWRDHTPGFEREFVSRALTFYSDELHLLRADGTLRLVEVPASAQTLVHREWLLVELRDDWTPTEGGPTHPGGTLLAAPFEDWLAGERALTVLFTPDPSTSLAGIAWTRNHLVLTVLQDVRSSVRVLTPPEQARAGVDWERSTLPGLPALGSVAVRPVDRYDSDDMWITLSGFDTPTTLLLTTVGDAAEPVALKSAPAFFDASGLEISQHFAQSQDGTRVPYFLLVPATARRDGTAPTLLYGYGGFEISLLPAYSGTLGRAWLEQGGVYALANIRGGGEYGPAWHQAALREKRHRAYEDFASVAQDLVARGVTTPEHLGVQGGSNGGLLTGNMLTRYPELFGAVVIQVPLLDMRRYTHLLAGASWAAEYGDPDDPEQWEFIRTFSAYHLLDADRSYPPVLLTTSTRDDRVHPGHARKTAAWLRAAGKDVTYYENVEGGHGGAADNSQAAFMSALAWSFLRERLG
ncbi:prolyl oligopeptidase family protein [Actinotalea sp.]|uniref:prolyl oligopeptidase family serine peptidase n=1 Tax=Actinotalea sp. TaxID=1872145 RepID=UPI00356822DD